jgi:hypothetical protein
MQPEWAYKLSQSIWSQPTMYTTEHSQEMEEFTCYRDDPSFTSFTCSLLSKLRHLVTHYQLKAYKNYVVMKQM